MNVQDLRKLWQTEFLLEVRKEIKKELQASVNDSMAVIRTKLREVEDSQKFIASKYDSILAAIQEVKKDTQSKVNQLNDFDKDLDQVKKSVYEVQVQLDELQQYTRRDSLELCGIPVVPNDDPVKLVIETAKLAGLTISKDDISIAHRLPPTRKVKDRMIVKFTRRETKDRLYRLRGKLKSKRTKDLETVRAEPESTTVSHKAAIHINESLTPYRKRLFGKVLEFKRRFNYKYAWTTNGKILIRETDSSPSHSFTTFEQLEDFIDSVS
ncbi:hypothetical protein QZH41_000633 [Actinostola sp. cb2023]|nr:hypothetical protein QZH41_000633 [Actinostola sp. cb2023]